MYPLRHRPATAATALLVCAVLTACGTPPGLAGAGGTPTPDATTGPSATPGVPTGPPTAPPTAPPTVGLPSATPSPSGFPEFYPVDCAGRPTVAQVIRAVRRAGNLLPAGSRATAETGPLCSGTWQFTVLAIPGQELLAVVTRGRPTALTLITAGTDVCSVPVRVEAPPGIRSAAACP